MEDGILSNNYAIFQQRTFHYSGLWVHKRGRREYKQQQSIFGGVNYLAPKNTSSIYVQQRKMQIEKLNITLVSYRSNQQKQSATRGSWYITFHEKNERNQQERGLYSQSPSMSARTKPHKSMVLYVKNYVRGHQQSAVGYMKTCI